MAEEEQVENIESTNEENSALEHEIAQESVESVSIGNGKEKPITESHEKHEIKTELDIENDELTAKVQADINPEVESIIVHNEPESDVKQTYVQPEDYEQDENDDNSDGISDYNVQTTVNMEDYVGEDDVLSTISPELRISIEPGSVDHFLKAKEKSVYSINDEDIIFSFDDLPAEENEFQQEEEGEKEEKPGKAVEEDDVDKEMYIKLYQEIKNKLKIESQKNHYIERRVVDYMKRKKMEAGLRDLDTEESSDFLKRYKMQLTTFETQQEVQEQELAILRAEIESVKTVRDNAVSTKENLFSELQTREKEIGIGLIYSKTGKPISDTYVATLLDRQKKQQKQIYNMRLTFIRLRMKVSDVEEKLRKLERISSDLSLMDFEQLKLKFRSFVEKLEEKDDELNRLRFLCQNSIQILAHYKEKSSGMETDLGAWNDDLNNMEYMLNDSRDFVSTLKKERDRYRQMANIIKEESGLLTKPELLIDMEDSMVELVEAKNRLEDYEKQNIIKSTQVRNIRKNIEIQRTKKKHTLVKKKQSIVEKKRPVLPAEAFRDIKNRPVPNMCLRKQHK